MNKTKQKKFLYLFDTARVILKAAIAAIFYYSSNVMKPGGNVEK